MSQELVGLKIAILGGDQREIEFARILLEMGAELQIVGLPNTRELAGAHIVEELTEAVKGADVLIGPATGTDAELNLKTMLSRKYTLQEATFEQVPKGTPFYIGSARPTLRQIAEKYKLRLKEYMNRDDIAILNAIPTAEGAIAIAIEKAPITIQGCKAAVIGLGRIGLPLLRRLVLLGAEVYGVDRNEVNLAKATEHGAIPLELSQLPSVISQFDLIFNTVPTMILTKDLIEKVAEQSLMIDLASAPGGIDYKAAQELGKEAILALGLPGKYSPKTAGSILAKVIPKLILQDLGI